MRKRSSHSGFSLVELIVSVTILGILALAVLPMARYTVKREKEKELKQDLYAMRDAIDRYKDAADRGLFQIKLGTEGYPPDLDTLVQGVDIGGKKVKFLRSIPVDPMTGKNEWGLRSSSDDFDSTSTNSDNIFDVYSQSDGTALNGTKYKDW